MRKLEREQIQINEGGGRVERKKYHGRILNVPHAEGAWDACESI